MKFLIVVFVLICTLVFAQEKELPFVFLGSTKFTKVFIDPTTLEISDGNITAILVVKLNSMSADGVDAFMIKSTFDCKNKNATILKTILFDKDQNVLSTDEDKETVKWVPYNGSIVSFIMDKLCIGNNWNDGA